MGALNTRRAAIRRILRGAAKDLLIRLSAMVSGRLTQDLHSAQPIGNAVPVMALDLQSKKLLWKYTPTDRQFPFYSSSAIADGKVVLGGRDKMVHGQVICFG
jgi:outer membrane protein assembly factor BamB